jgi:hypothetical protein
MLGITIFHRGEARVYANETSQAPFSPAHEVIFAAERGAAIFIGTAEQKNDLEVLSCTKRARCASPCDCILA